MSEMPRSPRCVEASLSVGEPLAGNATTHTDRWLLLEVVGAWEREPIRSAGIGDALRAYLEAFLARVPGSRLQLIRRPGRRSSRPMCFVGVSSDPPWLLELSLESTDDLLEIDLGAVFSEGSHPNATRRSTPLHLVCTHGRRDPCCATFGQPVYQAMASECDEEVWQTTHVGGHRFAACILSLPEGYCYGRVPPERACALMTAHRAGRLFDLDLLRGRTCYGAPTQVAEIDLRKDLGELALGALEHEETLALEQGHRAHFAHGGRRHAATVEAQRLESWRPASCGDEPEEVVAFVTRDRSSGPIVPRR